MVVVGFTSFSVVDEVHWPQLEELGTVVVVGFTSFSVVVEVHWPHDSELVVSFTSLVVVLELIH